MSILQPSFFVVAEVRILNNTLDPFCRTNQRTNKQAQFAAVFGKKTLLLLELVCSLYHLRILLNLFNSIVVGSLGEKSIELTPELGTLFYLERKNYFRNKKVCLI